MKKTIIVEVCLLIAVAVLLMWTVINILYVCNAVINIDFYKTNYPDHISTIELQETWLVQHIVELIFTIIGIFVNIAAMIIIAVKPLTGISPLVEKYRAWAERRKGNKEQKRKNQKQEQIAELEKKLNDLKKDE